MDTPDETDLYAQQIELEKQMTVMGQKQYEGAVVKARQKGQESNTAPAQELINKHVKSVGEGIQEMIDKAKKGGAGRRATHMKLLDQLPANVSAFLGLRCTLNALQFGQTLPKLALEIGNYIEDECRFRALEAENSNLYFHLVRKAKTRVAYSRKAYLVKFLSQESGVEWKSWSLTEKVSVGSRVIDAIVDKTGMFDIVKQQNGKHNTELYIHPKSEVTDWVNARNSFIALMQPKYEPMIVEPLPWTGPRGGGYLTRYVKRLTLVKTHLSGYLEELKNHDMPIVYDAINTMQNVPWAINQRTLDVARTLWEQSATWSPLPSRENVPLPLCPSCGSMVQAERKNHVCFDTSLPGYDKDRHFKWKKDARDTYAFNVQNQSKRLQIQQCISTAEKYGAFERIYFPYQLDFRGRVYAVPSFNPQGPDLMKSLMHFAEGKPIGEDGVKWLAIQGANMAGVDKVSFQDRVDWVDANEAQIKAIAEDPFANRGWVEGGWINPTTKAVEDVTIDKPWQFLAFCFEWAGYMEQGVSFVSHIPIALDGSCSGIQNYSMALRDEVGGAAVNLVPSDKPQDIYQKVADKCIEYTQARATEEVAQQWLKFGITRKRVKRAVMTYPYGSANYGFREQLMEDTMRPAKMEKPNDFPFENDGTEAASFMANAISQALPQVVVKAAEGMNWLKTVARVLANHNLPVVWHTPTNFMVLQAVRQMKLHRIRTTLAGNLDMRLGYAQATTELDKVRQANGISPNFIHSMDASHLMLTVVRAKEAGINSMALVHDSFGTCAADTDALFSTVREAFVEMYSTCNVFEDFRDEALAALPATEHDKIPPAPSMGTLDLNLVKDSYYAFA